jgi:pimeloyl-ACP methyl ester carboxylesterase
MTEQASNDIENAAHKSRDVSRRDLLVTAAAAGGLALANAPARAAIVRADLANLPPYGNSTLPPGIRSRTVENVNGLTVHMLEAGFETQGRPAVLLLHGFPELAYSWRKVMLPLAAAGYHVVAPDQRGYGRTSGWDDSYDADPDPFRILNMVRDATGLVYALGYRSVAAVVGHDAGSPVASWAALIRPDVFRSVALMSSPFEGSPSLPFNTANGAAPPRPAVTEAEMNAQLAALDRPRKYYREYNRTRQANDDIMNSPQGLHDYFRAYYHYKSADWKGNKPFPAQGQERGGDGEDPDLLRDGYQQDHAADGRRADAVGGRDRGVQVADRRRNRCVCGGIQPHQLHRRPAGISGPPRLGPQERRRAADIRGPHHRRAVALHRGQERLGRLSDPGRGGDHAKQGVHPHGRLSSVGRRRALGATRAA